MKPICILTSTNFQISFLVLCFLLLGNPGYAQKAKIAFEKYGVAEGLPEEAAMNMVQDKKGFMWITTQNGLVKFDGYNMQVYRNPDPDNTDLRIRNLNGGLLLDREGILWMGGVSASGGLYSFDPSVDKFYKYPQDSEDDSKVPYKNCFLLFQDIAGDIWFVSTPPSGENNLLCKINPKTGEISRYPHSIRRLMINAELWNGDLFESKRDSSIWINTDDRSKLMRYERKRDTFELVFQKGDLLPGTRVRDSIKGMARAGKSGLVPLTSGNDRHVYLWDPLQKNVVESYELDDLGQQRGAVEDIHGNIWVAQSGGGITLIDRKNSSQKLYTLGEGALDLKGIPKTINNIRPAYQDEHYILFNIFHGPPTFVSHLRYTFSTGEFDFFDSQFNDEQNLFSPGFRRFHKDRTGLMWIATRPNFYKEAPKTRQIDLFRHEPENPGTIPSDTISQLYEDSRQRLWVGTQNGISVKTEDNSFQQFYFTKKGKAEALGNIYLIYEDKTGGLWVGTYGKGLFKFNEARQEFRHIDFLPDIDTTEFSYDIEAILEDDSGRLWVSVWRRGVYILDKNRERVLDKYEPATVDIHGLTSDFISNIYQDSRGDLWLGDAGGNEYGLYKYLKNDKTFKSYAFDPKDTTSLISNEVHFITEDDLNRLWVGTDGGLCLFDQEQNHFYRNKDRYGIPSVSSYQKAGAGRMWVTAYSGGGLALVGPGINDVQFYGEEQGLLHNDVAIAGNRLTLDDKGRLWLPNQRGLSVFDTRTKTFNNYFETDGFQPYSRFYSTTSTRTGMIWVGGLQGLNGIDPDKLAKKDTTQPGLVITKMGVLDRIYSGAEGDLFEKAVPFTDLVTLDHTQRDLSFEFVALHYLNPEDNLYSWKLENYDQDWTEPSKERKASYTNLSPGTYTFRVRGSNADGVWNEEGAAIQVTINPPWWQTWWAYTGYLMLLGFLGYRLHLYQKARTLEKAQQAAKEKELEQAREIKKAYAELKATQDQLIQSEKMASLGELTAGIAHEIQNPLNFVNNFAEVNRELIEELKEESAKKSKERDAKLEQELLSDIDQNLDKISHHGKRADSIVKGMLQHSRNNDGTKEPTDINQLADEYLRLAYHGLRAKDKSFNAAMETDFDPELPRVDVVPQDIGRVLLNLLTNAFHAVSQHKDIAQKGYEPTVWIKTKKAKNGVEITVEDNGGGIPAAIREKIFQPFFTTKSTGEGTGLGLSMSYDIVTKGHGGQLNLESKEGEGAKFFVTLPV